MHRLEPGSVLVCESVTPSWTPTFAVISAAVCDSGGTLSHAAIVGREYGIPTVTAVGTATTAIADGDLVEVDGTTGTVTVLGRTGDPVHGHRTGPRTARRAPARARPRETGGAIAVAGRDIVWLDDAETPAPLVGTKMARLSDLLRAGVAPVPDGFTVTTAAFATHLARSGLGAALRDVFARVGTEPAAAAAAARDLVLRTPVAESQAAAVRAAYAALSQRGERRELPVAVRSSAPAEDGSDASFAGMHETLLGVTGAQDVLDAVRASWASLFTERAVAYRRSIAGGPLDPAGWATAVGVQRLLDARSSGVAFSAHPELARGRVLDTEELGAVGALAAAVAHHLDAPADVEWVVEQGRGPGGPVHVVQARPMTATGPPPRHDPAGWASGNR
nr:PEP/pyruvate-binding domain-containing protein [Pseudonocardia sp. WMMC193]